MRAFSRACPACPVKLRMHDLDRRAVVLDFVSVGKLEVPLAVFRARYLQTMPWKRRGKTGN